jgi:Fur family ferric uptake transcriptional regulator
MLKNIEKLEELRKKGFRITPQREQILEFFKNMPDGDHLSAEELHSLLDKNNIKISLATLYRSLKFLVEHGFLRELDFAETHKHYEYTSPDSHHHHLICSKCGRTIEFEDEGLFELVKKIDNQYNFYVTDYQFKIFGICSECRKL